PWQHRPDEHEVAVAAVIGIVDAQTRLRLAAQPIGPHPRDGAREADRCHRGEGLDHALARWRRGDEAFEKLARRCAEASGAAALACLWSFLRLDHLRAHCLWRQNR